MAALSTITGNALQRGLHQHKNLIANLRASSRCTDNMRLCLISGSSQTEILYKELDASEIQPCGPYSAVEVNSLVVLIHTTQALRTTQQEKQQLRITL